MKAKLEDLVGRVLVTVNRHDDELVFVCDDHTTYKMYHEQECCEGVCIDDIDGPLDVLVGSPILFAEEVSSVPGNDGTRAREEWDDSFTWTFYRIGTAKGGVTIRWYGTSNGYYSESVDFVRELAAKT